MGPWCRIITIVALHAKLLLATLPRFPSESSRSDASHVSKQRTPSPLAIQKTQVFEAVENGRQRLRARRLSLNVTKGQIPIWKDRRFQQRRTCSKTADCEPNDYCMSCAKCAEYHAHLPKEQQRRWTCDPCGDTEHICESGKYCTVAQDPVEGSCPSSYPGCSDHAECGADEYCFSCQKCDEYINTKGDNQSIWRCEPCPTTKGGFCSKLWWCPLREDSITGSCPAEQGCGKHSDCKEGEFCEGCQKCLDFQASLSESARANWPCEPCPTTEGGICEPTRLCQLGNTGIDGTCPPEKGCNSHVQCLPDEYCMDCQKCEAYRDSLSESQRAYWPCGYCPTGRGGHCERRIFCSVADDGVSECPLYEGCFKHQDCKDHEFCWSWKKCQEEDVQNSGTCGDKPRKDGFCNVMSTCNTRRSIDGQCRGAKACNSHRECGDGLYCVSWSKCNERSPDICGPEPAHRAGVCLPIEHCVHGFHPPLGGECPAWSAHNGSAGGHLEVSEVLKLNSTLMLAVWGQAMNSWRWIRPNQERDLMLAHLHDYASNSTVLDDSEHVGIYEVTAGKMQQQDQVQLSCPFVEVAIPAHGPRFYEARIFMDEMEMSQKHAECSCILGESGRCPRGARFLVPSIPPDPPDFCIDPPVPNEEILPNYTLNYLQSCSGSVQVDTYSTFTLESPGASVRYLRLDSFQIEEVSVPGAGGLKLIFDGQNLQCEATLMAFTHCGTLQRGKKIPVVLSFLTVGSEPTKNTLDLKRYCTNCRAAIKRFHPVFFYDSNGQALRNSLSLYSMGEDMKRRAKLVDSRRSLPETGVGESTHGCPVSEAATSKGVSLSELRDKKVLPPDYQDHWCVVQVGTCSITSKVKYCIVGGAAGVLIMEAPGDSPDPTRPVPDKQGQVYLSDGESLNRMVPVIYSVYNEQLWNALMDPAGATVLLEVGPNVGVRPANSHAVSPGGVRIYDSLTKQWHFGGGGFGAERWMEHSQVRDILFVCTASEQLIALDTSRPDYMLVKVGQAPDWLKCGRSSTPRDRHLLDFKPGCPLGTALASPSLASLCGFARRNFISLYVDAEDDRNHLIFFDTESLSDWKLLTEVHANWEHETDGLGQVVVTQDSSKLLVTWHCSTIHCGTSRRTDGSAPGEHIYVLDLMQGLELGHAPPVLAAVHVPMSPGSIIRDVQCNDQRLCLVSLSWDGVAVIDMAEGPNRFKVIAEHSATFAGWASPFQGELAEDLAYLRMVVGAQKVVASRSRRNRFYIERWSFDMEGWSTNGGKLMDSLRFDSIWAVDVENYVRPTFDVAFAPDFDPAVSGRLIMPRVSWARVSAQMREFEIKMIKGLQEALKVDPARIKVLSSKRSGEGDEGVEMDFTILDGKGSSPETLFNALWRQLTLPFSALHRSQIKEEVSGASLIRVGPLPISLQQSRSIARVMHPDPTDGFFRVLLVLALLVLAGFTLWLLVRSKNAMNKLREENRQLKADLHRHTELAGNAPLAHATGYVIGRPESHQGSPSGKDPDARDTAGSLSYVVGSPIPEPPAREAPSAQSVQARDASDQPEDKPPAEQDGVASTVRAPTRPVGSD